MRNIEPISQPEEGLKNGAVVAPSIPRYEVEQIAAPTLVIAAEDDLFGTFRGGRYTTEHIPSARFVGYRFRRTLEVRQKKKASSGSAASLLHCWCRGAKPAVAMFHPASSCFSAMSPAPTFDSGGGDGLRLPTCVIDKQSQS